MRTAATFFLLLLTFRAAAQTTGSMDRLSTDAVAAFRLPAAAVAVVKDDRVIYLKGFNATPDTLFQIASTSKAFTTTAMAMLVDEKKMSWDDPVRKHLPYFQLADSCADSIVTLRDLVSHRTGLSRHDELWDYGPWTREEIIRRMATVELTKPIRTAYQYNNIMFMTAGETVAAASGMAWEDFVRTRIFEPLGMSHTAISEEAWQRADHAASMRYSSATQTYTPHSPNPYVALGPAGSIKSTARDLAQWVRFQLAAGAIDGKRLLSEEALKETWKPHSLVPDSAEDNPESVMSAYGLGWRVQDYRGKRLVSHGGALNYYRAQVAFLPDLNAGVVVLTNTNRGYGIIGLRNSLLDLLIGKEKRDWNAYFLAREKAGDEAALKSKKERDEKRHRDTKPSRELSAYAGTYSNDAYGPLTITQGDNGLVLKWTRLEIPLVHYHYDVFQAVVAEEDMDELVPFTLGTDGEVKSIKFLGETFKR